MQIFRSLEDVIFDPETVVSVGTYDGIHLGHQKILSCMLEKAKVINGRTCVVTFEPHPREVVDSINGNPYSILTTVNEKLYILEDLSIDIVWVMHFNRYISELTPDEFIENLIVKRLGVIEMVEGFDHLFGRNRSGDLNLLRDIGKNNNFSLTVVEQFKIDEEAINSSMIRLLLKQGEVNKVHKFLGRPYNLIGTIVKGDRRGHLLKFPTANIKVPSKKQLPNNGVYLVSVNFEGAKKKYHGMLNIGFRPTFGYFKERTIEVYILDFNKEIYGEQIEVEFLERIRDEKKFKSSASLIKQLESDRVVCLSIMKSIVH